ncbi:MAG TPA: N-acetylmuramoyl-L-alanine amidase [Pseudomonadota bacterium]|nr:N-acetylmuramoyl-L-alanine amidase [Pseudomonadota bacterium]
MSSNKQQRFLPSGNIVVCGRAYNIGWPVVNWYDNPNFAAYRLGCYKGKDGAGSPGPLPFAPAKGLGRSPYRYRERRLLGGQRLDMRRLQDIIRQFVLHHDGCASSADCFHVLHDERGLSAHFLIDNNGWIYQTLDLADGAFHASGVNEISIGVELCNRGQVELDGEHFYSKRGMTRSVSEVVVHNTRYRMWEYTNEQYMAMAALGKALARLFPNLPQVYPQWNGMMLNTWMADPRAFAGYIGHYHVTNNKWDPGCFNFAWLMQKIRVSSVWFVCLDKSECPKPPEIAENPQIAEQQGRVLYRNNEEEAMGGYFPIGPFGRSRLWHGGIHLSLPLGAPVFTPFPGRIVAARFSEPVPTGSASFVLMRHYFRLAGVETMFFILYMHLERADPKKGRIPWLHEAEKKPFFAAMSQGSVFYPDIDVGGGEVVGHVGEAGPPGNYESQIHLEVLSPEDLPAKLEPGSFKSVDGKSSGHFCDMRDIVSAIDRPKGKGDGILTEKELRDFFQNNDERAELHKLAARFQSEWGDAPDWEQQLAASRDFRTMPKPARARLYREQIKPTLWYTPELAEKVGLPKDFVVWHYHPVRFVAWMNGQLRKQATTMVGQIQVAQGPAAAKVTDDRDSLDGFVDEEDEMSPEASRRLTLEDLANGYPEETPQK